MSERMVGVGDIVELDDGPCRIESITPAPNGCVVVYRRLSPISH